MALLTNEEITKALASLPGWARRDKHIMKQFVFPTFPDAIASLVRLAFEAEAADHHPDVTIDYRKVTLAYWTHSEGGLTKKDVEGAQVAETLLASKEG